MFKFISFLFHPFSFFLLGTMILFNTNSYVNFSFSDELKIRIYILIVMNTMIFPGLIVWYLSKRNIVESIYLEKISDRKIVYIINFSFYVVTLFLLSSLNVPSVIYKFAFGCTMVIGLLFVFALLNRKYSAHLAAIGGLVGALVMKSNELNTDFIGLIFVLLILGGIVGMSRLMLNAHKEQEIYLGFLIGLFSQILIFS